jgi:uncharacterized SAM-binding protein YcdF (DUF218 family)
MTAAPMASTQTPAGSRRPLVRRLLRRLLPLLVIAALAWCAGLVWFAAQVPHGFVDDGGHTDAIVVLTGGSQRLEAGLTLLADGRGNKLFVSGVHAGIDTEQLLQAANLPADSATCCIALGHAATDTAGNAQETAAWMQAQGYTSLRLVTSNYHMLRSLFEFRRAMPAIEIVPHPVAPESVEPAKWWRRTDAARLMIGEYDKYLLARLRPRWVRVPPPQ